MNGSSNGEFPVDAQSVAPAPTPDTRPLYWSVRRELWENRFVYIAPIAVAAFVLFGSLISMINLAMKKGAVTTPFRMAPAPIMLATFLVGIFYSLDALYGERRDRSILFWKSLPVSDLTTVLAKTAIPLVVLPVIAFTLSVATQIILLLLTAPVRLGTGARGDFEFFGGLPMMAYGLTVHILWFAPIYGWLILVSAWARRTPLLWAVLPPLAIAAVERIVFSTSYFMSLLKYRVAGAMKEAFVMRAGRSDGHIEGIDPARFLSTAGLWVGLAFTAAFLATAVRLRRNREPI